MKLGCRAHDFGRSTVEDLAARITAKGLTCVQLAPSKAITGIDLVPGALNGSVAHHAGKVFKNHGIEVSVLGCYVNPIHPDRATRRNLLEIFKEHLRYARDFGCGLVALETGSVNADYSPHPDNRGEPAFEEMLKSIGELVKVAETCGVMVGVEAVTFHTVSSPVRMRRLLDEISSDHIGVVFDPVNYLDARNWTAQAGIFREAFDLYGEKIVAVHAKDFMVKDGEFKYARLGAGGSLDAGKAFGWLAKYKPETSVLLEEVNEQSVEESVRSFKNIIGNI